MRLPLRHGPPRVDAPPRRCAHLEALAASAIGLPLGAAANAYTSRRSRGRYGNALQWHFGLQSHDALAQLDWEDRVEIKLVSVWRRGNKTVCDKVKVCDIGVDPRQKLSNVLWVFADRLTRVVVSAALWRLAGPPRERLVAAWNQDPHFGEPALFVEARESHGKSAPAYYLSARWFTDEQLLPEGSSILEFDPKWWNKSRAEHGRDPLATIASLETDAGPCPRCGGGLRWDRGRLSEHGWAPARHALPLGERCAVAEHFVVDRARLQPTPALAPDEFAAALEWTGDVIRLADRVPEPEDHLHG